MPHVLADLEAIYLGMDLAIAQGAGPHGVPFDHPPAWPRALHPRSHDPLSSAAALQVFSRPRSGGGPAHLLGDSIGLKLSGAGEWLVEKRGAKLDAPDASCILASPLTPARSLRRG
jgi:hypothetical protein